MADEQEKLLKLVNSSGFPFQLRIADQVKRRYDDPLFRWKVIEQEYPWRSKDNSREGFIDIILRNGEHDRMVLECKRTRDADWIFLLPSDGDSHGGPRAKMCYVDVPPEPSVTHLRTGWHDFYTQPESMISEFCIVRGTGEGQRPMLENLCRILLESVECFAQDEISRSVQTKASLACTYIPVIVTNASLRVCRFNPSAVSLKDGEVPDADFASVPYVRFSKTLSTEPIPNTNIASLGSTSRARERTVFVVHSSQLDDFLQSWYVPNSRENQRPWI